jgi:hypothetical protein
MSRQKQGRNPRVNKEREIKTDDLWWPPDRQASRGLGGNKEYIDFRGFAWDDANRILTFEQDLVDRIDKSVNPDITYEEVLDELYEDDEGLMGLDIGVTGVVLSLSVATCIPFTSCNGGFYGGHHREHYPLVGFYARPGVVTILLEAATEADIGMITSEGEVFAYSDNVRSMLTFGRTLLNAS